MTGAIGPQRIDLSRMFVFLLSLEHLQSWLLLFFLLPLLLFLIIVEEKKERGERGEGGKEGKREGGKEGKRERGKERLYTELNRLISLSAVLGSLGIIWGHQRPGKGRR